MKKRFASALITPVGILSSTFNMTETTQSCFIMLILSFFLLVIWIYSIVILKRKKKQCGFIEYGLLVTVIIMVSTSTIRLRIIQVSNEQMETWTNMQNIRKQEIQKVESELLSSNNLEDILKLAGYYAIGANGFEKDLNKTEKYLQLASDKGYNKATRELAEMYYKGYGCQPDYERSYALHIDNVKKGDLDSVHELETMVRGDSVQILRLKSELKDYYDNEDLFYKIMKYLTSNEDSPFVDLLNDIIYNDLIDLSNKGYILADKMLYIISTVRNSKYYSDERARTYAKKLYMNGIMPELPMDQYLFIRDLDKRYEFVTWELKYNAFVKYDYYHDLIENDMHSNPTEYLKQTANYSSRFPTSEIFHSYNYARHQYKKAKYLYYNYENINTLLWHDDKSQIYKDYLLSIVMLEDSIKKMDEYLHSLYVLDE